MSLKFRYPVRTGFEITNVKSSHQEDSVDGPIDSFDYDIVTPGLDGSVTTTSYHGSYKTASVEGKVLSYAGSGRGFTGDLQLVRQVVRNGSKADVFQPTPAITVFSWRSGKGTTFTSAGVDTESGTAMSVQGEVTGTEAVDVCGTMIDTYRVSSTERIVNLKTPYVYQTDQQQPNVSG